MTREIWKDIPGTNGLYRISNMGNVKSFVRKHGELLKPSQRSKQHKYLTVCIRIDGKRKMCPIHRLVAEAFVENPNGLPQVNHKNEDKTDNRAENLEWCNNQYNNTYGTKVMRGAIAQGKAVVGIFDNGEEKIYPTQGIAARENGTRQGLISNAIKHGWKTGGAYWKWA